MGADAVAGRLSGKVILISGAARGQGEAAARRCAGEGASLVLGDPASRSRARSAQHRPQ